MIPRTEKVQEPVQIEIKVILGKGWRRNRDIDNLIKPLIDVIKNSGIITDDNSTIVKRISIFTEQSVKKNESASIVMTVQTHEEKGVSSGASNVHFTEKSFDD